MGGGSWNGKNFGGLHTGADKKQNSGPYSSDGYIRNPRVSHLDFVAGEEVIYIGSSKYKHKTNIPNGTKGTVLEKEGGLKSARSVLRIDFKEHGVRYVRKELLQFPSDYSESLEDQLDRKPPLVGNQSYRTDSRRQKRASERNVAYSQTLENRKKNKEFREWRKSFLDEAELTLEAQWNQLKHDDTLSDNRKLEVSIKKSIKTLKKDGEDENQDEIRKFQQQLKDIKEYEESVTKEKNSIAEILRNKKSRQLLRNVYNRESYNNYLHSQWNNLEYVFQTKPSREYVVQPETEATSTEAQRLLMWGLYPQDVF